MKRQPVDSFGLMMAGMGCSTPVTLSAGLSRDSKRMDGLDNPFIYIMICWLLKVTNSYTYKSTSHREQSTEHHTTLTSHFRTHTSHRSSDLLFGRLIYGQSVHQCGRPCLCTLLAFAFLFGRLDKKVNTDEETQNPSADYVLVSYFA